MYSSSTLTPAARPPLQSVRLLDQVRERIRYLHYSLRTEQAYLYWVRAFVRFHGMRHPRELAGGEVERFLNARMRIKDVDFDRRVIVVRDGKGSKDRMVMLPQVLLQPLKQQTARARAVRVKLVAA